MPSEPATLRIAGTDVDWRRLLVAGASVVVGVATVVQFASDPFHVSDDSALFQHAGWYLTQGATLYVDVWDLKPPLIYAVTTALAVVAGGNMAVLHLLSVAAAVAAVAGGVVTVGVLAHRLTGDPTAGLAAAGTMFVVPSVYLFPYAGVRPKYFAFLSAALALLFAVDDRPAASGAAAATAAGFWQLGAAVAPLVAAVGWQRTGRRGLARTLAGGLLVAAATVLPFVLAGLTVPLFVETVLAPLYGVERYTLPGRLLGLVVELGYGVLLVPLGAYGWYRGVAADPHRHWWVAAGGLAYSLQLFLELQGAIETILLVLFLALGVGLLVAHAETPARRTLAVAGVVVLAAASLYWAAAPATPVKDRVADAQQAHAVPDYPELPADPDGVPSMQTIHWEQRRPDTCHYRLGDKQKYFEHATGGTLRKEHCGQWPFDQPPPEWLLDRLLPANAAAGPPELPWTGVERGRELFAVLENPRDRT